MHETIVDIFSEINVSSRKIISLTLYLAFLVAITNASNVDLSKEGSSQEKIRLPHSKSFILAYSNFYTDESKSAFDSGSAPSVRIISPNPGQIVSCRPYDQKIKLAISDPEGVDWESLSMIINRFEYLWGDPQVRVIEDSILCFTTIDEWEIFYHGDTVQFALMDIADMEGNHLDSTVNFSFIIDTSPPEIVNVSPEMDFVFIDFLPEFFEISVFDKNSGLSDEVSFTICELEFNEDSRGIWFEDFRHYFRDGAYADGKRWIIQTDSLGLEYSEPFWEDTILITMTISDTADVCGGNCQEFHWHFFAEGEDAILYLADSLENPYISLSNPNFDFYIYDPNGIDRESITVDLNGCSYNYAEYGPYFVFRSPRYFTFRRPSAFEDGETISMNISADNLHGEAVPALSSYEMIVDTSPPGIMTTVDDFHFANGDTSIAISIIDTISRIDTANSECSIIAPSSTILESFECILHYDSDMNINSVSWPVSHATAEYDSLLIVLSINDNIALGQPNRLDTIITIHKFPESCLSNNNQIHSSSIAYNHPNPFNSSTNICFSLSEDSYVILSVFDIMGKRIKAYDFGHRKRGTNCILIESTGLKSGQYFYKLQTPNETAFGNMLIVK